MLVELIDRLDESIGAGAPAATLRAQLSVIRDQLEAVETEIQQAQTRIKELETKLQGQKLTPQQDRLGEMEKKLLKLLFQSPGRVPGLEQIARTLGLSNNKAQYHADRLEKAEIEMIELVGAGPDGVIYILTPKGRAYVVEHKLAE
jgi:predicted ArsR family transcriptional regulator